MDGLELISLVIHVTEKTMIRKRPGDELFLLPSSNCTKYMFNSMRHSLYQTGRLKQLKTLH